MTRQAGRQEASRGGSSGNRSRAASQRVDLLGGRPQPPVMCSPRMLAFMNLIATLSRSRSGGDLQARKLRILIPIGERNLRRAIEEFVEHCHRGSNHHGIGNELIEGGVVARTKV